MPYVGRSTDKLSNVEVLDNITFNGSSSYTLQKGGSNFTPSSANTLLVSIDGVVQAGNFTVSGSTIDFGTAVAGTSTCDFILHYGTGLITTPADGTVTTAKLANSSVSLDKLSATGTKNSTTFLRGDNTFAEVVSGITEADQWRLTAALSNPGTADITANLERVDDATFAKIGTGMTESSGIFSFPVTGLYLIRLLGATYATSNFHSLGIKVSTDSGSTYDTVSNVLAGVAGGNSAYNSIIVENIVNVTNISTFRVKFSIFSLTNGSVRGNTAENQTHFTFIRLGDSV